MGANTQSQVSDHLGTKVAFGAGKTVALWNVKTGRIERTLKAHSSNVHCVKFNAENLISAGEDGAVCIWSHEDYNKPVQTFHFPQSIVSLGTCGPVVAIACADGSLTFLVKAVNGVYIQVHKVQSLKYNFYPLAISMARLNPTHYLIALGGTATTVLIASFCIDSDKLREWNLAADLEGHEDWVKSLAFRQTEKFGGDFLLASGSLDRYIRIWRIRINELIDDSLEDPTKLTLLSNKEYKWQAAPDLRIGINFDALIMGHDDWISCIQWHDSRLQLLASTADTALMVWEPDETSGIWACRTRLGEVTTKGASTATGSSGGFWSCLWFPWSDKEDCIITNGKTGSWRMWIADEFGSAEPHLGISGAMRAVTDIAWSPDGSYLLATSLDQTTRLYAPWQYEADGSSRDSIEWYEFSRPQIHGYDMMCIESMSNKRFISGGDEKILRSFEMPRDVAELLKKLVGISLDQYLGLPESASVPVLGLSNKAHTDDKDISEGEVEEDIAEHNPHEWISSLSTPPLEDHLQRHLLWPEIEKLYGHGYEIACVDVSPNGKLIASACKSNSTQHAVIRIFDSDNWTEFKEPLKFHSLTITRLQFSPDGRFLLSVCRDRKWAIWEKQDDKFILKQRHQNPHTRIIWDCSWSPSEAPILGFVTGSRDKTIKFWESDDTSDTGFVVKHSVKHTAAVTSVAIYNAMINDRLIIATGLETGDILIYQYTSQLGFELLSEVAKSETPADRIMRIRWKPRTSTINKIQFAAASNDNSVRIYTLNL